ncbi:MAG TPA: hypothetical protein VF712_12600 [Thermoleophilaceae bacterium]|jgi:hypothetical protein
MSRLRVSSYPALVAARAKWDRGVKDLDRLEERIRQVNKGNPYRVEVQFDRQTGWHSAYVRIVEQPPPDLSVLVGEAAYQFLSALNVIVWELAERKIGRHKINQGRIANYVSFPITKRPKDFKSLLLVSQSLVSKKAITRLDGVQAYRGPDPQRFPLLYLKPLADLDKHRVIAGALGGLNFQGVRFAWDEAVARNPTVEQLLKGTNFVHEGTPLARIRFEVGNAEVKVDVNRQPPAGIAFTDGRATYTPDMLRAIAGATRWVITDLTPLFPGEDNPWGPPFPRPDSTP